MKLHLTNAIIWFICALCFLVPIIYGLITNTTVFDTIFILRAITGVASMVTAIIHLVRYIKAKKQ